LLFAGTSLAFGVLVATRPTVGSAASWTGDELAIVGMWWGAVVGSLWLAATTLGCIAALARGHVDAAQRVARVAPPLARRVLQAALVGTWALVPAAAYAAPPSAPITVHVDAHGRLEPGARRSTTTTTAPLTTTTTIPPATRLPTHTPTTAATPSPSSAPAPHPAPSTEPSWTRVHVVVPGDNLWLIARAEVSRASGTDQPTDAQIAPYWQRVMAANRTTLRSGDPSLIFPGEVVALP
jgi:nucleoid-associated protein YgaU